MIIIWDYLHDELPKYLGDLSKIDDLSYVIEAPTNRKDIIEELLPQFSQIKQSHPTVSNFSVWYLIH